MCKARVMIRNEVSGLYTRAQTSHRKFWWKPLELSVKQDQTVGLVSQLGFTGTSGARTRTFGPYWNFRMKPETILSHASACSNYTNRNFQCLTGTSGEYRNFQTETGTVFSNVGARGRQRLELPVWYTGTFGARLSNLLSFDKSTFYPHFANKICIPLDSATLPTTQIKICILESKRLLSIKI
jgi:hypothetical protein